MLTKNEHRFLKAEANQLKALYQIGKGELGGSHFELFDKALTARELIKVSVLKTAEQDVKVLADEVAKELNADLIETKGRTFVLFRRNPKAPHYKLPK